MQAVAAKSRVQTVANGAISMSSKQLPRTGNSKTEPLAATRHTHRRFALAAVAVIAVVVTALLVPIPLMGRASSAIGDLVHAPLFGSLAFATLWAWQRLDPLPNSASTSTPHQGRRLLIRGVVVWISLSLFGLGMEFLQGSMGRSLSRHDAIANSLGIAAAVFGYAAIGFRAGGRLRTASGFAVVAFVILAVAWYRPVAMLSDVARMPSEFPLLASFESSTELTRWHFRGAVGVLVQRDVAYGQQAVEVTFAAEQFPAITLIDTVPNWSGYDFLELDARLDANHPAESEMMLIKIIDATQAESESGAFQFPVKLIRGRPQRIRVPLVDSAGGWNEVAMDWTKIRFVDIGLVEPSDSVVIRFDRLILTN